MVEVATFRTDGQYKDGRHPEQVTFATAENAQRRDFTCNGLFYDPVADQLHDFVHGQEDIAAKILRAIGEPHIALERIICGCCARCACRQAGVCN